MTITNTFCKYFCPHCQEVIEFIIEGHHLTYKKSIKCKTCGNKAHKRLIIPRVLQSEEEIKEDRIKAKKKRDLGLP